MAIPARAAAVKEAALFYHQGLFDSSLARLEAVKTQGNLRRRDSLSLFQYLGMASARLGREPAAIGYFGSLLQLDSLFQFPRNEDPDVLRAFSRAREERNAPAALSSPSPLSPPVSAAIDGPGLPKPPAAPSAGSGPVPGQDSSTSRPLAAAAGTAGPGPGILLASTPPEPPSSASSGSLIPLSGPNPPDNPSLRAPPPIGFAMGALPLGTGWFARNKVKHGFILGLLQAGGIALSIYASDRQSREQSDAFEVEDRNEASTLEKWQWVQRVSLSTAVGAYLFSLIASTGDR
jgi:hypothetical protein